MGFFGGRADFAAKLGVVAGCCALLAACSSSGKFASRVDPRYGTPSSPRVVALGEPVPKGGGTYRVGKPYVIAGRTYYPEENTDYSADGMASWYGDDFHGRLTANGEVFDMQSISAAHPTLPMPSYVRVTNLANQRSLVVRVNDRGPYAHNRLIDLSVKAAQLLDFHGNGLTKVRVEYVGRAPLEGSDDRKLVATLRHGSPAPAPSGIMVASAKPFLAESAAPLRGAVPMPPDRPFRLGLDTPEASGGAAEVSASSRIRTARPDAAMEVSRSAYRSTRYDAPVGVMTGRGLY